MNPMSSVINACTVLYACYPILCIAFLAFVAFYLTYWIVRWTA